MEIPLTNVLRDHEPVIIRITEPTDLCGGNFSVINQSLVKSFCNDPNCLLLRGMNA